VLIFFYTYQLEWEQEGFATISINKGICTRRSDLRCTILPARAPLRGVDIVRETAAGYA
jgi:hypothetical protein